MSAESRNRPSGNEESARPRTETWLTSALAFILTAAALAWAADLFRSAGLLLYTEQVLAGLLGLALPLVFLTVRRRRSQAGIPAPWYDWLAAAVSFAGCMYMAYRYPVLAELIAASPQVGMVVGSLVLALLIEGLRRTVGMMLTGLVLVCFVVGLLGEYIPQPLTGRPIAWNNLFYYLAWDPNGILGVPMAVVGSIVIAFVFFGQVLMRAGGSEFFTEISMALVGRFRGGQAKIAVTASGLFGSISGSAVSNVVTTGIITIPLMRSAGYRAYQAAAIEAVASTGGQLMPPIMGAAAFLMAEFLQVPYTEVVLAALLPAVLYYAALFILADLEAAKAGITRIPEQDIPKALPVLKVGWFFPLPFVVLVWALFALNYTPEAAALLATAVVAGCAMVFGYKGKRLKLTDVLDAFRGTGLAVLEIFMIAAAAGVVIGVLNITGIGFGLSLALVELGGGNMALLLLISAGVCILLGMGMPTAGVYLVLATLIAPSLIEVGVAPMAAHLFILYFGMMSMITPPVAIAAYAAASVAGTDAMKTAFAAMQFGWLAYVIPFMFVLSPNLLLQGAPLVTVMTIVTALFGVWLVSAGLAGFLFRRQGVMGRTLLVVAGLLAVFPATGMGGGHYTDLAGLGVGAFVVGRDLLMARRARRLEGAPA